ncbi:uncharacterized protein ISCGN_007736 [Ixodes scapularis]
MYEKVKGISSVTFRDRPDFMTGTRVVKVEMTKTISNFISIQGHRVMVDYRGMRRVCSKCGQEGHIGPACKTPRCDRCAVFGHSTAGCTEPCQRCGHAHATVDCAQRKTYAAVTQSTAARPSCVQPQETATAPVVPPASEQPKDDPSPPVCPQDVPSLQGNPVAVDNSQLSDAGSLSSDAHRLVVVEDDEVTPGQGHPPSSPTSPRVSATPDTLEQLDAKAASAGTPAGTPAGASSAVDTTMECDRQEVKRGFSSSSSGSDAPSSAAAKKKRLILTLNVQGFRNLDKQRDFNCVLDAYRDIRGPGRGRANWNARELGRLVGQFDLRDVWCELHGSTFAATWSRAASSSRLDRAYFPAALVPYVLRCEVLSFSSTVGYVSDHYPLCCR